MGISNPTDSTSRLVKSVTELSITEKGLDEDLRILKEWYDKQAHLPRVPAEFEDEVKLWIQHLLAATKNSIERVKSSIESYMLMRVEFPKIFNDQLIRDTLNNEFYQNVTVITFPKMTPDKRLVFYWGFNTPDHTNFDLTYLIQRFRVVVDYHIQNQLEFSGFHSIFDMSNLGLSHLSQLDLVQMKKMISYATRSYPLRITNLHLINPPSFMEYVYNMITPFISKKIVSRLVVHKSVQGLLEYIPANVLPTQLEGTGGDLNELKNEWNTRVASSKRLLDSDIFVVNKLLKKYDTSYLAGVSSKDFGQIGTFRKLCVD